MRLRLLLEGTEFTKRHLRVNVSLVNLLLYCDYGILQGLLRFRKDPLVVSNVLLVLPVLDLLH